MTLILFDWRERMDEICNYSDEISCEKFGSGCG
jgi:hypothetical protein